MKRLAQEGLDLFGYDPAQAAAEFAAAHQGGLAPMALGGDVDGSSRNKAARADTLGDTGQANAYMVGEQVAASEVAGVAEAPQMVTEEAVILTAAERARQFLANEYGIPATPLEIRQLTTGQKHFEGYAGRK